MTLYLVRHGQDDPSVRGGWSDSRLTAEGRKQAEQLANELSAHRQEMNIRRILTSDLPRALETVRPIAAALSLPAEPRPEFREVNNGLLAGMKNDLALRPYPGLFWNTLGWEQPCPGGESPCAFYARISNAWSSLSQELAAAGCSALLVTHGGVIQVIRHLISGTRWSNADAQPAVPCCSPIAARLENGVWYI